MPRHQITFREWMHHIPSIPAYYKGFLIVEFTLDGDVVHLILRTLVKQPSHVTIRLDTMVEIEEKNRS